MDYYVMVLRSVKKLLESTGKEQYAEIVQECIENWEHNGDSTMFGKEFSNNGRFADFSLNSSSISDPKKGFWTGQTLSALIAMSAQLAVFNQKGVETDLNFIRSNFGAANEVMNVSKCQDCGRFEATEMDIDRYISKIVIAKKIVDGMERGNLDGQIEEIVNLTAPEIEREHRKTLTRLENTGVPYTNVYGTVKTCLKCGSKKISTGRLLRSNKENVFVPLKH